LLRIGRRVAALTSFTCVERTLPPRSDYTQQHRFFTAQPGLLQFGVALSGVRFHVRLRPARYARRTRPPPTRPKSPVRAPERLRRSLDLRVPLLKVPGSRRWPRGIVNRLSQRLWSRNWYGRRRLRDRRWSSRVWRRDPRRSRRRVRCWTLSMHFVETTSLRPGCEEVA
jgi:hypothetical protein